VAWLVSKTDPTGALNPRVSVFCRHRLRVSWGRGGGALSLTTGGLSPRGLVKQIVLVLAVLDFQFIARFVQIREQIASGLFQCALGRLVSRDAGAGSSDFRGRPPRPESARRAAWEPSKE
jgi:hypothetical protein